MRRCSRGSTEKQMARCTSMRFWTSSTAWRATWTRSAVWESSTAQKMLRYIISFQNEDVSELFREYRSKGDRVLYLPEFMVFGEQGGLSVKQYAAMAPCLQEMMDAVKGAGWTRFQSVEGQPIPEKDMRSVFKLVDLDKDGTISGMVHTLNCFEGGCLFKQIFLFRN